MNHGPYQFIDQSERSRKHEEDICSYGDSESLGRDLAATIVVKWINQQYHDENLRAFASDKWDNMKGISKANTGRHRNQYYPGLIVRACLDADYIDEENSILTSPISQPTGVDSVGDQLSAYVSANKILLCEHDNPNNVLRTLEQPDFARLHDVAFNDDGSHLLTASSSLDLLYELDTDGNIAWSMDLWDIENTNKIGQQFRRSTPHDGTEWLQNPDPVQLMNDPALRGARCVINDPSRYDHLGLPTNLIPVFVNSIAYGQENEVLVTTFHKGEGWIIDRDNQEVSVIAKDMGNPHGLRRDLLLGGYVVSDTANERVSFLSEDLKDELVVDFTNLPGHKPGQEQVKWLQNVTRLDTDLYCAVMSSRQQLTLFDPVQKLKRSIQISPDWGVQLVSSS